MTEEKKVPYTRPSRPTQEHVELTWRDHHLVKQRLTIVRWLIDDPQVVLDLSKHSLSHMQYGPEFREFWGTMILNDDIEGLIIYHQDATLPIEWFHGHPVTWPGKFG